MIKTYYKFIILLIMIAFLQSCTTTQTSKNKKNVHGDKPLIDTSKIIVGQG